MKFTTNRMLFLLSALVLAGGLVAFASAIFFVKTSDTPDAIGGPFALIDQNGRAVDQNMLKGKATLLLFGFTHCPDVCPTKLYELAQLVHMLGKDGDRVNVVFASIDPERDTPALLKEYLASFDQRFIGLTGSPAAIAQFTKAWRAFYRKVPSGDSYTMDHTAAVYLLDKTGRFSGLMDTSSQPERVLTAVKSLL